MAVFMSSIWGHGITQSEAVGNEKTGGWKSTMLVDLESMFSALRVSTIPYRLLSFIFMSYELLSLLIKNTVSETVGQGQLTDIKNRSSVVWRYSCVKIRRDTLIVLTYIFSLAHGNDWDGDRLRLWAAGRRRILNQVLSLILLKKVSSNSKSLLRLLTFRWS